MSISKDELSGNTRFLASLMTTTGSMQKWLTYFFLDTEVEIQSGKLTEEGRYERFCQAVKASKPQGMLGPIDLETIDWKKLYEYCKGKIDLSAAHFD